MFGEFTALELLRLKSILETTELKEMYSLIPVRSDTKLWNPSIEYGSRKVYETELKVIIDKTMDKEQYIIEDPHAGSPGRTPQVSTKNTVRELGTITSQEFTGEISQRERAEILYRRQELLVAVIAALKEVNDVEAVSSDMTSQKLFSFLHKGVI